MLPLPTELAALAAMEYFVYSRAAKADEDVSSFCMAGFEALFFKILFTGAGLLTDGRAGPAPPRLRWLETESDSAYISICLCMYMLMDS